MIPLVGSAKELENQRDIVVRVAEEVLGKAGLKDLHYLVGTMIEIPACGGDRRREWPSTPSSSASAPTTLRRPPWVSRATTIRSSRKNTRT